MGVKYIKRVPPKETELSIEETGRLAEQCNSFPVLIYALSNRGYTKEQIIDLLQSEKPGLDIITKPLNGSEKAATQIIEKLNFGEGIGIFADYDCDGITSGYVMYEGLSEIKKALKSASHITVHYPQRSDGYGLSTAYCQKIIARKKTGMVITVDNGITTRQQCSLLLKNNIVPVVTDHHEPNKKDLPDCTIVNPCYNDLKRSYLAGVAVSFNVVNTIADMIGIKLNYKKIIPAVAVGTISDCMPMSYENSCYIRLGLDMINNNDEFNFSFLQLMKDSPEMTPKDVSFSVAPKINSASRIDDTRLGAAGFFYEDQNKIMAVIDKLDELNNQRKQITADARETVAKINIGDNERIVIFDGANYGKGIHGIIASEITKRFPDYPAFVYSSFISSEDGAHICAGSVRCANTAINVMSIFEQLKDMHIIRKAAGHSSACVIEVAADKLDEFIKAFSSLFDSMEIPLVTIALDGRISIKEASNQQLLKSINKICFTVQEAPLFGINDVFINKVKYSKNNPENICFYFSDNTASKWVWIWGFASKYKALGSPKQVHLVCSIEQDFMKKTIISPTLNVIDMIPIA